MHQTDIRTVKMTVATFLTMFVIATIMALSVKLMAQLPPLPPGSFTNVTVKWDPAPASDVYTAVDTNGNLIPLIYRVRHTSALTSTNSITNFVVVASTTNNQVVISNLSLYQPHFFIVTVSNFFLESDPSSLLGLPAAKGKIDGLKVVLP